MKSEEKILMIKSNFPHSFQLLMNFLELIPEQSSVDWSSGEEARILQQFLKKDNGKALVDFDMNKEFNKLASFPKVLFYILCRLQNIAGAGDSDSGLKLIQIEAKEKRYNLHQNDLYSYISFFQQEDQFLYALEEWLFRPKNRNRLYRTLFTKDENGEKNIEKMLKIRIFVRTNIRPRPHTFQRKRGYTDQGSLGPDQPTISEIESEEYQLIEARRRKNFLDQMDLLHGLIGLI